jgi:phenylacetate-CoA ligase
VTVSLAKLLSSITLRESSDDAAVTSYQHARLTELLTHAWRTTTHYKKVLGESGWQPNIPLTASVWANLPILKRRDLQGRLEQIKSNAVPRHHGGHIEISTSGSTGRPITVLSSELQQTLWRATTIREHQIHGRDFLLKLGAIRVISGEHGRPPNGTALSTWGPPVTKLFETGPAAVLSIDASTTQQVDWLVREKPDYLLTYPSNLRGILDNIRLRGITLPNLKQARTMGEAIGEELREICAELLDAEIADIYSAQELGYIALQEPSSTRYAVRHGSVFVELLDARDQPVAPGDMGRVVITGLLSYASPLIRYDIGDYAMAVDNDHLYGAPHRLAEIIGRVRNLLVYADGSRRWPRMGVRSMCRLAPIAQFQLVQDRLASLILKVVASRPISVQEEMSLRDHLRARFGDEFAIAIEQVEDIPRSAGGKFEEFRCEVG